MNFDKRTRARELAMQSLYQLDVQGPKLFKFLGEFFIENEPDDFIRKLASDWTKGTWENLAQCDELISASAIKWHLARLATVDKSILRLCAPPSITITKIPINYQLRRAYPIRSHLFPSLAV